MASVLRCSHLNRALCDLIRLSKVVYMREKKSFPTLSITNPNKIWVCEQLDSLIQEWKCWNEYCTDLEDSSDYNPGPCSEAIKDGYENIHKHEILLENISFFA